jgi:hypothetical protein
VAVCASGEISRAAAPAAEMIRGVAGRRKALAKTLKMPNTKTKRKGIATQIVSQFAERSVRQLATEHAQRGAFSERTNEMAAVAHPVGMEVVTARCRNSAEEPEWRRQKEINRRAKEVIQARQKKEEEDAARAAHNGEVVRQSAAGAAEKKRKRRAEKNKRQRKNKQVKKMHEEWKQEFKEKAEEDWEAQSNAVVEEGAVLVAVQWRTRQAVRALRAATEVEAADAGAE